MIQQTEAARKAVFKKQESLETRGENTALHGTYLSNLNVQEIIAREYCDRTKKQIHPIEKRLCFQQFL